jgi:hypothetical protein
MRGKPAAALSTNRRLKVWVVMAYHPETGEVEGYITERDTITDHRERAVEYQMEEIANGAREFLSVAPGYRAWLWVVDEQWSVH